MVKNQRIAGRLNAVTAELAEATEAAARTTALETAPSDALFVIDASKKKRKRTDGTGEETSTKRAKLDASAASATNGMLVDDAMAAVAKVSKAKFFTVKPPQPVALSKAADKLLKRTAAQLKARDPAVEKEKAMLLAVQRGVMKTSTNTGGYNLTDAWSTTRSKALTTSRPLAKGALAAPPVAGTSYNPSLEAHQDALAQAVAEEEAHEARRALLRTKTTGVASGASWDREAEDAAQVYLSTLDMHDPDEDEDEDEDEEEGEDAGAGKAKAGASAGAASGSAATGAGAPALPAVTSKGKKKNKKVKETVESALAAVEAEDKAKAAKKVSRAEKKNASNVAVAAGLALPYSRPLREAVPTFSAVPSSDELRGSLRTMKPVAASSVVMDAMAALVARGDAPARKASHNPYREDVVTGELKKVPMGTLRRTKKLGHPYTDMEFPRRRQFEPAMEAVKEAEAEAAKVKKAQQAKEAATAAARKAARLAAAQANGLQLPA